MFCGPEITVPIINCNRYKENWLNYYFGDLEHQFDLSMDPIQFNEHTLRGKFTFSKDLKLKSWTI